MVNSTNREFLKMKVYLDIILLLHVNDAQLMATTHTYTLTKTYTVSMPKIMMYKNDGPRTNKNHHELNLKSI